MVFYFYSGLRSENPNHRFLGLIGLSCLAKTVTTSSSTSSTSSSITSSSTTFLPLPPLLSFLSFLSLPPLSPILSLLPLLSFSPCCGKASNEASDRAGGARHCGGVAPRLSRCCCYSRARFSDINGPGVGGVVAFFLTGLLSLFVSSKIAGSR